MRYVKLIFAFVFTLGLIYLGNTSLNYKGAVLPPLMPLLNPVTGFWANARPETPAAKDFPQLKSPVRVIYDEQDVPHIFAENLSDALFMQGYLTAKNRLWQMDITARAAAGRLSEVFGARTLGIDSLRRGQGVAWAAERAVAGWQKSESYALMQSYTAGVNAHIAELTTATRQIEFKIFGQEPEPWTVQKTALAVKSMALSLCIRQDDIPSTNTLKKLGEEEYNFLFPDWNPQQSPIIPTGFYAAKTEKSGEGISAVDDYIPHKPFQLPPENNGSNNWAISAAKSATGNPILCNDPHLNLTLPAIWYELQIHTPETNAYGVSVPGIPGILIGFNENIAWGETNVGHDLADWYRPEWTDATKSAYLFEGQSLPTTLREELIYVKGEKEPIRDTVVYTHFGPVTYSDPAAPAHDLAFRWIAHDVPDKDEMMTFLNLAKAKNHADYRAALRPYGSPAQNFVFAAKDGDIAITVNGKFPVKKDKQGQFVLPGNTDEYEWKNFIPRDSIPQIKNPKRGFVSSANQHSTGPDYPYAYHGGFADYRGRYLNRKLREKEKFTVQDMMNLQADTYSLKAEEALPLLIAALDTADLNTNERNALDALAQWDYRYAADATEPLLFDRWWKDFYRTAWDELETSDRALRQPEAWRTISLMAQNPDLKYWDILATPERENFKDLAMLTFRRSVDMSSTDDMSEMQTYAAATDFHIPHLGRLPMFAYSGLQIGGTPNALNANRPGNGPSWRMVVELGDTVRAWGVYPGGQSGAPFSPHFDDMVKTWEAGEYYSLHFYQGNRDAYEGMTREETYGKK